jgi:4-amino-4-deoxy-L-arabinose transferase-like glycosyltransferase
MPVEHPRDPGGIDLSKHFQWFEKSPLALAGWVLLLWAMFVFPAIGIRSFQYEEGYAAGVARAVLEDSHWFTPHLYGWRFVERPHLMSWIIAALGALGGINQWTVRLAPALSLLAGGLLIFFLVRRHASALAAWFAVLCFFTTPMILGKATVAEPDVFVSTILFAAFVVWWSGHEAGGVTLPRWLAIGAILAAAALAKGPQPIAYFGLGIAAFHALRRQWTSLGGLMLAGVIAGIVTAAWYWCVVEPRDLDRLLQHAHLERYDSVISQAIEIAISVGMFALQASTALVLVVPFTIALMRSGRWRRDDLALALLLYAFCCTVVLFLFPGVRVRYSMPAVLALAAASGLAFEPLRAAQPRLVNVALAMIGTLASYQIVLSWIVMPAAPESFQGSRIVAQAIEPIIRSEPAVLYNFAEDINKNVLAYIRSPVRVIPSGEFREKPLPAWILIHRDHTEAVRKLFPDLEFEVRAVFDDRDAFALIRATRR